MKTFIIAELSANHNNDFNIAVRTIESMAESGADAVKIQTYKPQSLTLPLDTNFFAPKTEGLWKGYTPWNLYSEAAMPYEWQPKLQKLANELGLEFFSSPFDIEGVEFLESLNVPRYKIASMEINDLPLIRRVAQTGKPIIMSAGVAEISDIELAIEMCREVGNNDITILKCTSQYPATIDQANLRTISDMQERFGVKVGLSDHTMGYLVPVVAVSLGAVVVEKHFILDRAMGGPDSAFSMEPHEFTEMVKAVRDTEKALGKVTYRVDEKDKLRRRSLFVSEDIPEGGEITRQNVRSIRPGHGLAPIELDYVIGKKVKRFLPVGTPLQKEDIKE